MRSFTRKTHQGLSDRRCRRRGVTIVEFSLTFLLFVVIVLTLMELGRGMWTYTKLAHAARQAGRYCVVRGSTNPGTLADVRAIVERHCSGLELSNVVLNTTWNPDDATPKSDPALVERGDIVEVRVSYPFRLVTGQLVLAQNILQMSSTTRMVVAN